jgi:hypothetical protein
MERITLGQLLDLADGHMEAAESARRAGTDRHGVVRELGRVLSAVARCLAWPAGDGQVEVIAGTRGSRADRAAAGLQEAVRQAGARIDAVRGDLGRPGECSDPVVGHLAAAADALNAGCDLIGTHCGTRLDNEAPTSWARLIASEPVTAALRAEMARWSVGAGAWVDWLASQAPDYARTELTVARHWLTAADVLMPSRGETATEVSMGEQLLHAVPLASPPDRRIPTGDESPAELCAGITISADRLRAIITALSRQDGSVASATGPSWFHAARAAAVVSDLAIWQLGKLSDQAAHVDGTGAYDRHLQNAVNAFAEPRAAWQMASQLWRYVTTGPQGPTSAVTAELDDLVLRMGRLASGNPRWTPARRDRAPRRDPVSLVSGTDELAEVLSAVHHAADAVAWMASADLETTTAFGNCGYLYMSNRFLESPEASMTAYIALPDDRLLMLQDAYRNVVNASQRAARALDAAAIAANAPSRTIGYARRLLGADCDAVATDTSGELDAEGIARWFTRFTRPCRGQPIRRTEINALAVIRAYRDECQTLDQCAARFGVSQPTIGAILEAHGIPRRPTGHTPSGPMTASGTGPPTTSQAALTSPAAARPEPGFTERRLLNAGIADTNLLARAAAFDKAADNLLAEAIMATGGPDSASSRPQSSSAEPTLTAARLAARDLPDDVTLSATSGVGHARKPTPRRTVTRSTPSASDRASGKTPK